MIVVWNVKCLYWGPSDNRSTSVLVKTCQIDKSLLEMMMIRLIDPCIRHPTSESLNMHPYQLLIFYLRKENLSRNIVGRFENSLRSTEYYQKQFMVKEHLKKVLWNLQHSASWWPAIPIRCRKTLETFLSVWISHRIGYYVYHIPHRIQQQYF